VTSSKLHKARRPEGFRAPGPRPVGDLGEPDLVARDDEDLSYLAGDWRIFQPRRGHRWSLDDLMTAWVAAQSAPPSPHTLVDLGCGLGSVLMLMAWAFPEARVTGLEAQAARAERARRSLRFNGANDRCFVVDGDLRDIGATLRPCLNRLPVVVTGTPPYFDPSATKRADDDETAACRVEIRGGLEVYLDAAAQIVDPAGVVVLCYPVAEGERAKKAGVSRGLSLSRRLEVVPRAGKAALIVVDVFRREACAVLEETLTVRTLEGAWTEEFRAVRRRFGMPAGTQARSIE
jgi:tRNA1Val (adenine37-N6)-methyltransferase